MTLTDEKGATHATLGALELTWIHPYAFTFQVLPNKLSSSYQHHVEGASSDRFVWKRREVTQIWV